MPKAHPEDIIRRPLGDFPIASSIVVPAGTELVFLVGDPTQGGAMDFAGLMKAWGRYFGAPSQGKLPTRTTAQVVALPIPGALVEIEPIDARKAPCVRDRLQRLIGARGLRQRQVAQRHDAREPRVAIQGRARPVSMQERSGADRRRCRTNTDMRGRSF